MKLYESYTLYVSAHLMKLLNSSLFYVQHSNNRVDMWLEDEYFNVKIRVKNKPFKTNLYNNQF